MQAEINYLYMLVSAISSLKEPLETSVEGRFLHIIDITQNIRLAITRTNKIIAHHLSIRFSIQTQPASLEVSQEPADLSFEIAFDDLSQKIIDSSPRPSYDALKFLRVL